MATTAGRAALVVVGLVLAGCGLIDESDLELGTSLQDSTEQLDRSSPDTGDQHEEPDTRDETASAPEPTELAPPDTVDVGPGTTFTDPQGTYEMNIDPIWIDQHGSFSADIEVWFIRPPSGGFAPNVSVLTQLIPDMELEEYLDLSVRQANVVLPDAEVVNRGIVQGTRDRLGFMEYRGTQAGNQVQFLAYFTVHGGKAVVATLTTSAHEFDATRSQVEPLLQTLHALAG